MYELVHKAGEWHIINDATNKIVARQYYPPGDVECLAVAETRVLEEAKTLNLKVWDASRQCFHDFTATT